MKDKLKLARDRIPAKAEEGTKEQKRKIDAINRARRREIVKRQISNN